MISKSTSRPVTMADVGSTAGATAGSVSNVLSGKSKVRPQTRDAVLRAVKDLGYQMNVSARGLHTGQTGFITLAIPDLRIEYFATLTTSIMQEAERHNWTVIIQQTGASRDKEVAVLSAASRQLFDGLLFQPHALGPGDEKVLSGDRPLVLLGDRIFDGPVDHVTMANSEAAFAATEYLINRGHKRIAVIGANPHGGPISAASLRLSGYENAMTAHGLPVDPRLTGIATEWHQSDGAFAMGQLLDSGVDMDAVFCFNHSLAIGALHTLANRRKSVPTDIAVVGFDNVAASAFTIPSLTTIDPGTVAIAKTAIDLLARRIKFGSQERPTAHVTEFALIARKSA